MGMIGSISGTEGAGTVSCLPTRVKAMLSLTEAGRYPEVHRIIAEAGHCSVRHRCLLEQACLRLHHAFDPSALIR